MAGGRREDFGVVLHRRPYRETSLVLECLTAEAGRVGLVAKGARRGGRHARLEPLHEYELAWVGRGELHTLTSAEPRRRVALQGEAAICALYVNELLLRLLARDDPHPAIYPAYWRCLDALDDGMTREPALRNFEYQLLHVLGYGFARDCDARGQPLVASQRYLPGPDGGLETTDAAGQGSTGANLLAWVADDWSGQDARADIRRVMRAALAPHLGTRPLEAPRLLQGLRRLGR